MPFLGSSEESQYLLGKMQVLLFGGEELFCPLRKQQTFVFMSNTKISHLIWIMQNPHPHQRCLSLQERGREVLSSTCGRDGISSLSKQYS